MRDSIERIAGNAFTISLIPESLEEKQADAVTMSQYYYNVIQKHLGDGIQPASITPQANNPFCATVELMTESGST
jgi:hypothetical protein